MEKSKLIPPQITVHCPICTKKIVSEQREDGAILYICPFCHSKVFSKKTGAKELAYKIKLA